MPKDNPIEIAEALVQENGLESAIQVMNDRISEAHQDGDNFSLSVWREVRRELAFMENKTEVCR